VHRCRCTHQTVARDVRSCRRPNQSGGISNASVCLEAITYSAASYRVGTSPVASHRVVSVGDTIAGQGVVGVVSVVSVGTGGYASAGSGSAGMISIGGLLLVAAEVTVLL
jgi:hypothetical protein